MLANPPTFRSFTVKATHPRTIEVSAVSTDPGAPYYAALVTPGGGLTVQDRATQGGQASTMVSSGTLPAYLWVTDAGNTLTAYGSANGYVWAPIAGSAATINLGTSVLAGLAVTAGSTTALSTATADSAVVSATPPGPAPPVPCPAPWTCADIGSPAPAGSQSFDPNSGTWTINGGGADITGTSDQFRYVWQTLSGDGSVVADVTSQANTSSGAKAGPMFRASTDPAAPEYSVLVSPGQGIKVQVRKTQGGNTSKLANPTGTVPAYLKITRSGSTWTQQGGKLTGSGESGAGDFGYPSAFQARDGRIHLVFTSERRTVVNHAIFDEDWIINGSVEHRYHGNLNIRRAGLDVSRLMSDLRDTGARYEMDEQGMTSWADYRRSGDRLYIDYVFAPPALRGTGASGRLMAAIAADARAHSLRITPICGYAAAWLKRSKAFGDLVG